jgi:hypothetical protein
VVGEINSHEGAVTLGNGKRSLCQARRLRAAAGSVGRRGGRAGSHHLETVPLPSHPRSGPHRPGGGGTAWSTALGGPPSSAVLARGKRRGRSAPYRRAGRRTGRSHVLPRATLWTSDPCEARRPPSVAEGSTTARWRCLPARRLPLARTPRKLIARIGRSISCIPGTLGGGVARAGRRNRGRGPN